jgi:benzoylformate decarboxylase
VPPGARVIQITDNPSEAGRAAIGESILADPGTACGVLADRVKKTSRPMPAPVARAAKPAMAATITAELVYALGKRDDTMVRGTR